MYLVFAIAAIFVLAECAYLFLFALALLREYGPEPMIILLFAPAGLMAYVALCALGVFPVTLVTSIAAMPFMVVIPLVGAWFSVRVWRPYYSDPEEKERVKKLMGWQKPSLLWQMTATAITLAVTVSVVLTCVKVLFLH